MDKPRVRLQSIQLLRAIAAAMVALMHAHDNLARSHGIRSHDLIARFYAMGGAGVHLFFVISGVIMVVTTMGAGKYDSHRFFRRRLTRIYGVYIPVMVLYLIAMPLIGIPYRHSWATIGGALLLLPDQAAAIIPPAWTLVFELYFYGCFGLAMLLGVRRGLQILSLAFLAMIGLGMMVHSVALMLPHATSPLLLEFLAGAWLGWLIWNDRLPARAEGALWLGVMLFAAGVLFDDKALPRVVTWGVPSVLVVGGALLYEKRAGLGRMAQRFASLGNSSYALYLIHLLIYWTLVSVLRRMGIAHHDPSTPLAFVFAALAIALGHLFYRTVERPLLGWLNAFGKATSHGAPTAAGGVGSGI